MDMTKVNVFELPIRDPKMYMRISHTISHLLLGCGTVWHLTPFLCIFSRVLHELHDRIYHVQVLFCAGNALSHCCILALGCALYDDALLWM